MLQVNSKYKQSINSIIIISIFKTRHLNFSAFQSYLEIAMIKPTPKISPEHLANKTVHHEKNDQSLAINMLDTDAILGESSKKIYFILCVISHELFTVQKNQSIHSSF